VLRLNPEAIALDVDDPHPLARLCGPAARRPFAVADANPPAVRIDRLRRDHDGAEHSLDAVVEDGVGRMVVAHRISAAAADADGEEGENSEDPELQGQAERQEQ
jgi:hypothetical protein